MLVVVASNSFLSILKAVGMLYGKASQIGDRGELVVAERIIDLFGWPCRLHAKPDVGIDASVEVDDGAGQLSGKIISLQIKTTESSFGAAPRVVCQVEVRHIEYWQKANTPVILCYVSLMDRKVLWKPIAVDSIVTGCTKNVRFDIPQDELTASCKDFIRGVADEKGDYVVVMISNLNKECMDLVSKSKKQEISPSPVFDVREIDSLIERARFARSECIRRGKDELSTEMAGLAALEDDILKNFEKFWR